MPEPELLLLTLTEDVAEFDTVPVLEVLMLPVADEDGVIVLLVETEPVAVLVGNTELLDVIVEVAVLLERTLIVCFELSVLVFEFDGLPDASDDIVEVLELITELVLVIEADELIVGLVVGE